MYPFYFTSIPNFVYVNWWNTGLDLEGSELDSMLEGLVVVFFRSSPSLVLKEELSLHDIHLLFLSAIDKAVLFRVMITGKL